MAAAHTLSDAMLEMVLHPQRATRLLQQNAFDAKQLGLKETISILIKHAFKTSVGGGEAKALQTVVQGNLLQQLMRLGQSTAVPNAVRGEVHEQLYQLNAWIKKQNGYHLKHYYQNTIQQYFNQSASRSPMITPKIPDGSPIGSSLRCQ